MEYTRENLLQVAKRYRNNRRLSLLVNPLQGKHIPVSPEISLEMMRTLGGQLAKKYPEARFVVGFAETATAIGAAAAGCFPSGTRYVHTTREALPEVRQWIEFAEEHSHAVEQKLSLQAVEEGIRQSPTIIFVDDEISTGRTLLNMMIRLREEIPGFAEKKIVAASLLNRLDEEHQRALQENGISCEYLVRLPQEDFDAQVRNLPVEAPQEFRAADVRKAAELSLSVRLPDPRCGVSIDAYLQACERFAEAALARLQAELGQSPKLLVLGTEECMFPALLTGKAFEEAGCCKSVSFHATTRSPIGVYDQIGYPVRVGFALESFYEAGRKTYIYDMERYDAALIVTDAAAETSGLESLNQIVRQYGCEKVYCLRG